MQVYCEFGESVVSNMDIYTYEYMNNLRQKQKRYETKPKFKRIYQTQTPKLFGLTFGFGACLLALSKKNK